MVSEKCTRFVNTDTLDMSFDHGGKADLCLAMGSSLTVTPAANIPEVCHVVTIKLNSFSTLKE